jgi:GNAT superfamily N-acetyltransferase
MSRFAERRRRYLMHQGSRRALIEGVRVARDHRGTGLGTRLFEWAIQRSRPDARRLYGALGFVASHEGMKLAL